MATYGRERSRDARGAEHGKGEYENHDLSAAIQGATQDVVVFSVPSWVVLAQPELRYDSNENARGQGGVHADGLGCE